jgi:hypothetical protein
MCCDYPGCSASMVQEADSDHDAKRLLRMNAKLGGWLVATDKGVPELARDLCPLHRSKQ